MLTRSTTVVLPIPLFLVLATVPGPSAAQSPDTELEREAWVMGTRLTLQIPGPSAVALEASEAAFSAVRRMDDLLSTWRDDALLARANRAPVGAPAPVPPALRSLLLEAESLATATGRAFDPTVGALIDAWDLRGRGRLPDSAALRDARAASGPAAVTLTDEGMIRRVAAAWLDSGGFGKGAALRCAARALTAHGVESARLNFGGQILAHGAPPGRDAWDVWVAHPSRRDHPVATLSLRDESAATTGQSERGVTVGGARFGHVLDPRSGRPVPAWGSVTVLHRDPLVADVLSTALFVMGPDSGLAWAERHAVAALVLIDTPAGLLVRESPALARRRAGTIVTARR